MNHQLRVYSCGTTRLTQRQRIAISPHVPRNELPCRPDNALPTRLRARGRVILPARPQSASLSRRKGSLPSLRALRHQHAAQRPADPRCAKCFGARSSAGPRAGSGLLHLSDSCSTAALHLPAKRKRSPATPCHARHGDSRRPSAVRQRGLSARTFVVLHNSRPPPGPASPTDGRYSSLAPPRRIPCTQALPASRKSSDSQGRFEMLKLL
jgi:hypothetical protein